MKIDDKAAFANGLRELMYRSRVTATKLAEDTGISKSNLSQYLASKTAPTDENQRILADYFGVTVEKLCEGIKVDDEPLSEDALDLARRFDALPRDSRYQVFVALINAEKDATSEFPANVTNQKAPTELASAGARGVLIAGQKPLTEQEIEGLRKLLNQNKG